MTFSVASFMKNVGYKGGGSFCTRIPQVTSGILIHMRVALECIIKESDTVLKPKSIYIYVATVSLT